MILVRIVWLPNQDNQNQVTNKQAPAQSSMWGGSRCHQAGQLQLEDQSKQNSYMVLLLQPLPQDLSRVHTKLPSLRLFRLKFFSEAAPGGRFLKDTRMRSGLEASVAKARSARIHLWVPPLEVTTPRLLTARGWLRPAASPQSTLL